MSKEARISSYEMAQYRERLRSQKEFLTDILSKIEKQILSLQVERLHLRNTLLGSEYSGQEILPDASIKNNCVKNEPVVDDSKNLTEELDLSIAPSINDFEEETEDDDQFI
ncbi:PREDICTED: uncharacterized protein LOC108773953 [Cyphomyrmex costatus]|uniref:Uncharacterized protein n=1 Tax=Cyphomyrmex costatus TaxID=456900 RepID=A0A195CQN8_9HYME|nr:PREDICTED: uncharacterized protein LOC108773953 [Cyphomyrmex costatus]KYN02797.1 hypothetical protein ALC62_06375 [Cyphomyrmex costatus]